MSELANRPDLKDPQSNQAIDTSNFREMNRDARNLTSLKKKIELVECWKDLLICST